LLGENVGFFVGDTDVDFLVGAIEGLFVMEGLVVGEFVRFGWKLDGRNEGALVNGATVGLILGLRGFVTGIRVGSLLGAIGSLRIKSGRMETVPCIPSHASVDNNGT
jgi:hypothetical protein